MKGKLIVIEGACDGIGKTTQYNLLCEYLKVKGFEVVKHHFPTYNSKQGMLVEEYLKGNFGDPKELSPYFINSLYAIDRIITWNKELKKDYDEGKIILLDRYTTSSIIYQSALIEDKVENKEFIKYVENYEYEKLGLQRPDKVIFLNADFNVVTKLRSERTDNEGVKQDIHEANLNFMKKVYDNAQKVAKSLNFSIINCSDEKQMKSIPEIHEEIIREIEI